MEEYLLYVINNILQIRKSQQDAKLDKDLWNVVKNHSMEIEILNGDKSQTGDIGEDDKEEDNENIDLPTADLYSHAAVMMRMRWRK